jgi:superfamily II DNA or RNA helicase
MAEFDLLIVDEAHHFPSSFWECIVDFAKKYCKVGYLVVTPCNIQVLFLTATPYRSDGERVVQEITIDTKSQYATWALKTYQNIPTYFHFPLRQAQEEYIKSEITC